MVLIDGFHFHLQLKVLYLDSTLEDMYSMFPLSFAGSASMHELYGNYVQ